MKFFLLKNILWTDAVYIRFADHYAAVIAIFTLIFRKKLIIVSGGYDAVHIPEYNYGVYHSWWRGWCAKFAFRHADLILPNNPTLIENVNTYSNDYPRKEGIKHFVPRTKALFRVVYNGFNPEFWSQRDVERKENTVLTVAYINDYRTYLLKGIDSFISLAYKMPDVQFTIVGMTEEFRRKYNIAVPSNMIIRSKTPHEELAEIYYSSKVFCLLSLTEGMPNVLCEAMLCGCIPVGTNVNSIPEIIGDAGFVIGERKLKAMTEALKKGLSASNDLSIKSRERIIDNFLIKRREVDLIKCLEAI